MGWKLGEDGKPKRNSTIENRQWIDFDPSWFIENLPEGRFFEGVDKLGISVLQDLYDYKRNHVNMFVDSTLLFGSKSYDDYEVIMIQRVVGNIFSDFKAYVESYRRVQNPLEVSAIVENCCIVPDAYGTSDLDVWNQNLGIIGVGLGLKKVTWSDGLVIDDMVHVSFLSFGGWYETKDLFFSRIMDAIGLDSDHINNLNIEEIKQMLEDKFEGLELEDIEYVLMKFY
jgi:hypothetical protein